MPGVTLTKDKKSRWLLRFEPTPWRKEDWSASVLLCTHLAVKVCPSALFNVTHSPLGTTGLQNPAMDRVPGILLTKSLIFKQSWMMDVYVLMRGPEVMSCSCNVIWDYFKLWHLKKQTRVLCGISNTTYNSVFLLPFICSQKGMMRLVWKMGNVPYRDQPLKVVIANYLPKKKWPNPAILITILLSAFSY